jgi:hypothetical protein
MFGKKKPVLTATYCDKMEKIRQAYEVLVGRRASYAHIDFNTGKAAFRTTSDRVSNITFIFDDQLVFLLDSSEEWAQNNWHRARFDFEPGEVWVISERFPVKRGPAQHTMWWVGRSADDRRLEPLYPKDVEFLAQARGLSINDYLNSDF